MGNTELFLACAERPDFVRELLRIVTDKMIVYLDACWIEEGRTGPRDFGWTDDLAVSLSREMFESIALPANRRLREHFDGWAMLHMCGRSDHLLEVFRDGLRIDELQGFGWEVDLDRIAEVLGGRVVLLGNVNPMLIRSGSPDDGPRGDAAGHRAAGPAGRVHRPGRQQHPARLAAWRTSTP